MSAMERRKHRSERPSEALLFLLRATAQRYNLDALVLADHDGLVIQSSGDPVACDLVAAYAPLLDTHAVPVGDVHASLSDSIPAMGPCSIAHRPIGGVSMPLHVLAVGVARDVLNDALQHTTRSVARILSQTAAA